MRVGHEGSRTRWTRAIGTTGAAILCVAIFFRFQIANGFTILSGDRYDAVIEIAILQHWWNVLHGLEAWNVTRYFYPAADTLGYNDGYFLYGILYTLLRATGIGLIAAADAVHVAMKLVGFFGMVWALRTIGRCGFVWSLFGAALFTLADVTLQHGNHGQLFTLALAPYALVLGWRAVAALIAGDRRGLLAYGAGFLLLYALWISTAYYLAWFAALYAAIAGLAPLILGRDNRRRLAIGLRTAIPQLALLTLLGALLLAPFLLVYLPKLKETGAHPYDALRETAFRPLEYVNVTATNILWGDWMARLRIGVASRLKTNPDEIFGFAPLLFVLAVYAAIRFRRARHGPAIGALGIALLVAWLLMLQRSHVGAWQLVHAWVPGAGGIRVIGRFNLLLLLPAILLVTMLLERTRRRTLALALAALLLAEEANTRGRIDLDAAQQYAMLAGVPPPPAACRSFYVVSARRNPYPAGETAADRLYAHNVDAMLLSEVYDRPTVNGFSTFLPPHWDLADPLAPDYAQRVRRYAALTGIAMPCRLDVRHGEYWTMPVT